MYVPLMFLCSGGVYVLYKPRIDGRIDLDAENIGFVDVYSFQEILPR